VHATYQLFFDWLCFEILFKELRLPPLGCRTISRTGDLKRSAIGTSASSRIYSAVEWFAAICDDRRHYLSQSVGLLTAYLENQKGGVGTSQNQLR
jgi:hypothetical protein